MAEHATEPLEGGPDERYVVPALERGLRILGEFTRESRTISAPEFARRLGLPRSTVFRLLATLEGLGFIERVGNDYRLGMAVLRLGFEYLASLELTELGQPIIQALCEEIHHAVHLVVRDGRSAVYVAKVAPPTPFASYVRVGTRLPVHATVVGRILLEDLSLPQLRELYPEEQLKAYSENTPGTVLQLFDMVQQDRGRGYALGEGFFDASISSIAAAIRDRSGMVVAACGVSIPSGRIDPDRIDPLVRRVRAAAAELSALLNFQPREAGKVVALPRAR